MMKLLWIGDAVVQTGFARVTHCVLPHLQNSWDVRVLGINYNGDPHDYPYKIYPAIIGGDVWGMGRVQPICRDWKPDLICINNDPWNVARFLGQIPKTVPTTAYMPVDAPNQGEAAELSALPRVITYTAFGQKELMLGGYHGRVDVIPHGVDTRVFHPVDRLEARRHLNLKKTDAELSDMFIVGNVNRNQPRKRLDLTIQYWTQFWYDIGQPSNAYLYLHCSNRDQGWNVVQLARYYGIEKQLILTNPRMTTQNCMREEDLKWVYGMFDVQLTTTMGEGWGLTNHEGMACGIPQLMPRYSALAEWPNGAARYVDCTTFAATPQTINTIGGIPDMQQTVAALTELYREPTLRAALGEAALKRATEERFQWSRIGEHFNRVLLETAMEQRRSAPMGVEPPK
jgi:glycosyltransferase involved in cell wall biosynthesis